jgi:hypothetical protein
VFVSIGVFSLAWGVAHVWAAVLLRRHAPWPLPGVGSRSGEPPRFPIRTARRIRAVGSPDSRRTTAVRGLGPTACGERDKMKNSMTAIPPLRRC